MNDEIFVYPIPDNFIKSGTIMNGMLKIRNAIEALAFGAIVAVPLLSINYPSITSKISVVITATLPVVLVCLKGINGDTVTVFLSYLIKWVKNKRIMLYDNKLHTQVASPTQLMMARELPKDKIVTAIKKWKDTQHNKNVELEFIEGENFDFAEDKEYTMFQPEADKLFNKSELKDNQLDLSFEEEDAEPLRIESSANNDGISLEKNDMNADEFVEIKEFDKEPEFDIEIEVMTDEIDNDELFITEADIVIDETDEF